MILYKYLKPEYGEDVIRHLRIKVSNVKDFNDPFDSRVTISEPSPEQIKEFVLNNEGYLHYLYEKKILEGTISNQSYELFKKGLQDRLSNLREMAKTLPINLRVVHQRSLKRMDKIAFVTCFCGESAKPQDEILMWAHYTLNHTGMRIAFDSEYFKSNGISMKKINYKTERVLLNPVDYLQKGYESIKEVMGKALEEKSCVWSYENEYRLFIHSKLCQEEKDKMFFPIKPNAILGVDFGLRCGMEDFAMRDLVRSNLGESVRVRKTQPDDYEFKIQYIDLKDS